MSNDLIYTLIGESELPQIEQLWADGVSDEVFSPFFACLIANLADSQMASWYQSFIQATDTAYGTAIATGSGLMGSDAYWQHPYHTKLSQRIVEATGVDGLLLRVAFPLATHAGYDYISEQADLAGLSIQEFAKSKLSSIISILPAWADEVIAFNVLSQASVDSLVNNALQSDLGVKPTDHDDMFLVEDLDTEMALSEPQTIDEGLISTEIELSDEDFVLESSTPSHADELLSSLRTTAPSEPNLQTSASQSGKSVPIFEPTIPAMPSLISTQADTLSDELVLDFSQSELMSAPTAPQETPIQDEQSVLAELENEIQQVTASTAKSKLQVKSAQLSGGVFQDESTTILAKKSEPKPAMDLGVALELDALEALSAQKTAEHTAKPVPADNELSYDVQNLELAQKISNKQKQAKLSHADDFADLPSVDELASQSEIGQGVMTDEPTVAERDFYESSNLDKPQKHGDTERTTTPILTKDGQKTKKSQKDSNVLRMALPIFLLLLAAGGGGAFWYHQQSLNEPVPEPAQTVVAEPTPPPPPPLLVQSLPASHLSLTVGEEGKLYACRAELGNEALMQQVLRLLQANFTSTTCAIDVNSSVSQDMIGLDKLTSVIGLLKTSPFASLELAGDTIWIHSPNPEEVNRLVQDMGALMAGATKVMARPPLNRASEIDDSIAKGSAAMSTLPENADPHALARAMSVPIFDLSTGALSDGNRQLLMAAAERLKAKSDIRLIIVAHSDESGNKAQARIATKQKAELIKKAMVEMGVSDFQLITQGVGYDFPIMDNQTELGRFKNNRIEFLVHNDEVFRALNAPVVQEQEAAALAAAQAEAEARAAAEAKAAAEAAAHAQMIAQQQMQAAAQAAIQEAQFDAGDLNIQGMPDANSMPIPPAQFAPIVVPPADSNASGKIDDDLLRPIGSDIGKGMSSQVH